MILIESKRKKLETVLAKFPNARIVDITSKATNALVKFSPFYPHGDIPIPFSEGKTAMSVEGIWQGLKVFSSHDIDEEMFNNDSMKNLKRTVKKFGKPLGHRKGVNGTELLSYLDARIEIYLPVYKWVLENKLSDILIRLKEASKKENIVLLDYETNTNVLSFKKPLSHAYLVKAFVEGTYPDKLTIYEQQARETAGSAGVSQSQTAIKNWASKPGTSELNNNNNQSTLF